MNASPGVAAETPPVVRSVWRVVARAMTLTLFAVAWACSNTDSTSPSVRPVAGSRDVSNAHGNSGLEPIPGQYIITFSDSVSDVPGLAKRITAQYGTEPLFTYSATIKGFAARFPEQALEGLQHNPHIALIEQDAVMSIEASGSQLNPNWGLDRIDQVARPLDGHFTYAADGSGVHVYIIDTGIRTSHVDFGGRASGAFTAINDGNGSNDCNGHGTAVAAVAGGTSYGVAKAATLHAVRVLDCAGSGSYSALIAGIDWVTKNRLLPAVANISIAGTKSTSVNSAVEASIAAGVVYAVAAANYAADACNYSPASSPNALTAGASAQDITSTYDVQASFSDFGSCVDLFAPGSGITSAYNSSDSASMAWSGTSFSSPFVAGVAALYLSAYPTATPAQVTSAVMVSAVPNAINSVRAGTPNLLLSSNVLGVAPPPPADSAVQPPPPPPPPPPSTTPPSVTFTANGCPKSTCTFDGSGSTAVNGITSYSWTFGDGTTSASAGAGAKVSHSYQGKGSYVVTLTVTDRTGLTGSATKTVSIKK